MNSKKRQLLIWLLISTLIITLSKCSNSGEENIKEDQFAAKETCIKCHRDINDIYSQTAHFHTSAPVSSEMLAETLSKNEFNFSDSLKVRVEERNSGIFQVSYSGGRETEARRLDIVFGSGEKARTFGYWSDAGLFQLPLTHYSSINRWVNSPGFPPDSPNYKRAIIGGCLECHSSFAKTNPAQNGSLSVIDQVVKGSVVYGIDCQRCHGPAAKHVAFHEGNPEIESSKYIVKIKNLSRQQRVDNCAVCHSGSDQATQRSTFAFKPGDTLKNYYQPYGNEDSEPDVHGNQYQMLASSACFIKSDMDCSSCHNTHKTEKNNPVLYSQRCMNCHKASEHPQKEKRGKSITNNCIDCHMPVMPSKIISFQESGKIKKAPYLLRSHRIAIYPDEINKIYSYLKSF